MQNGEESGSCGGHIMKESVTSQAGSARREVVLAPRIDPEKVTLRNGVTSGPRHAWTPEQFVAQADARHLPIYITRDEAHRTFAAARKTRDRLFAKTLWVTGARVSEAIEVRSCDFDSAARLIRLHRLKKRRPHEAAVAGLPEDYCRELSTYIELAKPRPRDRLFPFTRFRALRLVRALMARAGIEPVYRVGPNGRRADMKRHPHAWRHGFAINLIVQGKPLEVVKELLGHSSILTTHIYSRALAANVRPFMEATVF